jgi:hypothetical protein
MITPVLTPCFGSRKAVSELDDDTENLLQAKSQEGVTAMTMLLIMSKGFQAIGNRLFQLE